MPCEEEDDEDRFLIKDSLGLHGADGNPDCSERGASSGSSGPRRAACVDLQWAGGLLRSQRFCGYYDGFSHQHHRRVEGN
jgi:hypothetical protein